MAHCRVTTGGTHNCHCARGLGQWPSSPGFPAPRPEIQDAESSSGQFTSRFISFQNRICYNGSIWQPRVLFWGLWKFKPSPTFALTGRESSGCFIEDHTHSRLTGALMRMNEHRMQSYLWFLHGHQRKQSGKTIEDFNSWERDGENNWIPWDEARREFCFPSVPSTYLRRPSVLVPGWYHLFMYDFPNTLPWKCALGSADNSFWHKPYNIPYWFRQISWFSYSLVQVNG